MTDNVLNILHEKETHIKMLIAVVKDPAYKKELKSGLKEVQRQIKEEELKNKIKEDNEKLKRASKNSSRSVTDPDAIIGIRNANANVARMAANRQKQEAKYKQELNKQREAYSKRLRDERNAARTTVDQNWLKRNDKYVELKRKQLNRKAAKEERDRVEQELILQDDAVTRTRNAQLADLPQARVMRHANKLDKIEKRMRHRQAVRSDKFQGSALGIVGGIVYIFNKAKSALQEAINNTLKLNDSFITLTNSSNKLSSVANYEAQKNSTDRIYDYLKTTRNGGMYTPSQLYKDFVNKTLDGEAEFGQAMYSKLFDTAAARITAQGAGHAAGTSTGTLLEAVEQLVGKQIGTTNRGKIYSDERMEQWSNAIFDVLLNGSAAGMPFTTEGWEGYAYEHLGYNPKVEYTNSAITSMKTDYILAQIDGYLADGIDGIATLVSDASKNTKILKSMANTLYPFDEVITNDAINQAQTLEEMKKNNDGMLSVKQEVQDAADDAAISASVTQSHIDLVKEAWQDGHITPEEIRKLLDDGLTIEEIAEISTALAGYDTTVANVAETQRLLEKTMKENVATSFTDLGGALDSLSKEMSKGINVNSGITVEELREHYSEEQIQAFFKAIEDNELSEDEYKMLKEMGWEPYMLAKLCTDVHGLKINSDELTGLTDLEKLVREREEVENNPLYTEEYRKQRLEEIAKEIEKLTGLSTDPTKNVINRLHNGGLSIMMPDLNNVGIQSNKVELTLPNVTTLPDGATTFGGDATPARAVNGSAITITIGSPTTKADGGIGTDPSIIEAFEKGPEAIIPLNDSGIQFMTDAIRNANVEGSLGGGDVNVNLTLSGLNISDKRDWEDVGLKIGQVIQNYKNRTGGI